MPIYLITNNKVRENKEVNMTNSNGLTFGSLTVSMHNISFEKIDTNGDGIVTQEELQVAADKNGIDILDLSCIDKDADSKVTEDEYILWQQEQEVSRLTDTMKSQIARDLVGQDADDIKKVNKCLFLAIISYIYKCYKPNNYKSNLYY